jgi:L-ascorbate metabolism protein UlaG (beta-lactamase superfamily)
VTWIGHATVLVQLDGDGVLLRGHPHAPPDAHAEEGLKTKGRCLAAFRLPFVLTV